MSISSELPFAMWGDLVVVGETEDEEAGEVKCGEMADGFFSLLGRHGEKCLKWGVGWGVYFLAMSVTAPQAT